MDGDPDRLSVLWAGGYSIAELWGYSEPVTRSTSAVEAAHGLLWGILSIVEYQVSKGAGHRYLRERLWAGDWIAIGNLEPKVPESALCRVPKIKDAKFGRKVSAIGDGPSDIPGCGSFMLNSTPIRLSSWHQAPPRWSNDLARTGRNFSKAAAQAGRARPSHMRVEKCCRNVC